MSGKKTGGIIVGILLLLLIGGALYFILKKKYYPKVESVEYIRLELAKDTAQVKTGVKVQNRIPLPIAIDSVKYTVINEKDTLGWGQMTNDYRLPPLGNRVLDFKMLLDFERYRQHVKEQQGKDSIRIDVAMDVYFDLPLINPQSISLTRQITVPVAKSPALELKDVQVRSFSVEEGYSLLLKLQATNQNLPGLKVDNFKYDIRIGDTLNITGLVDTTFHLQKGTKLLEIPLMLKTSDAIAIIKKIVSADDTWNYDAKLEAQIKSAHPLFDSFRLTIVKAGELDISNMGSGASYLPSIKQIRRLEIDSNEEQTRLQADVVIHNPAPLPFYIDSASYYIRYKGKVLAKGTRDYEKILPKDGDQSLRLQLIIDESAYQKFMKEVQGQEKVALDIELNLIYNLPDTDKRQKISLTRRLQVPVPGQAGLKVLGLEVQELDPQKGAHLLLQLRVESSNLPDLQIRNLDYKLQLSDGILIQGQTKEPVKISGERADVAIPIRLSAEDVNQLIRKAIKGHTDWNYTLQATATLLSSNKIIGPTRINLEFTGELELAKGIGGAQLMPTITSIDTLDVTIAYDTAWVRLNVNVKNPLPVPIYVDSLALHITHEADTFAVTHQHIGKTLPPEGSQTGWITLSVNYRTWREHLQHHQEQDSMVLKEDITLVYRIADLEKQRVTFTNNFLIPMPKVPVTQLQKVKFKGLSLTKGIMVNANVQVQNANTESLDIKDIEYNVCVENLLDACGSINRTYHIPLGQSTVQVPLNLGIGEVFRAMFSKLSGSKKTRTLYLNASAIINAANPKLQNTFVRFEKWEKTVLFKKKNNTQSK